MRRLHAAGAPNNRLQWTARRAAAEPEPLGIDIEELLEAEPSQ